MLNIQVQNVQVRNVWIEISMCEVWNVRFWKKKKKKVANRPDAYDGGETYFLNNTLRNVKVRKVRDQTLRIQLFKELLA